MPSNVNLRRTGDDDLLVLRFTNQTASEVSILLPGGQNYNYGTFSFSLQSVAIYNGNGTLTSETLPDELVLGLFTFVGEDYVHHEVDIEISTWNRTGDADVQFVIQKAVEEGDEFRFYSGIGETKYNQSGHWYNFTWDVDQIEWTTTAGIPGQNNYSVTTVQAIEQDENDFIQCLPQEGLDVRINLWSQFGTNVTHGLDETDVCEVIIDNFVFMPMDDPLLLMPGESCSKHCQCRDEVCLNESQVCGSDIFARRENK